MKFSSILLSIIILFSCNSNNSDNAGEQEIVYSLQDGYKAFVKDTTNHNDSLAREQAIYLARTYGNDGINQYASGIKEWLKNKGINYDSVQKKAAQDITDRAEQQKQMQENSLHYGVEGNTDDAFEKIHIAFEGMPEIEKVKPILEAVMTRYNIVINNDNVLKCANVLVTMKNESKIGVTEMEVLKHMYQRGSSGVDYATQAAISATYLEQTK